MSIDFNKPVRTKGGYPVRILCTDKKGDYPVIGLIGSDEVVCTWRLDGSYGSAGQYSADSLENVPEVVERWVNVYRLGDGMVAEWRKSRLDVDAAACAGREAVIKGTWENGKLVEVELETV